VNALLRAAAACALGAYLAGPAGASDVPADARSGDTPDEARYVNRPVPDVRISTTAGETHLSALWDRGPLLLTLVFTRCAGACTPYLRALRAADDALGSPADVHRVVLSFDPRDTAADMARTAGHLGVAGSGGWTLGVATPADIARLSRALGFWFAWDDGRQQFDHPAMVAGVRDGRVARILVGGMVSRARLAEVVRETRGQFVASYPLPGRTRFRCFEYDPATGEASLSWGMLVLMVPALVASTATLLLFRRRR
jgi:LPXTG-motif cell wall-anchored protein